MWRHLLHQRFWYKCMLPSPLLANLWYRFHKRGGQRWKENQKSVLDEIFNKFQNGFLVVRSSAVGEDSVDKSEAGKYESVLNVNVTYDSEIISAIEQVIDSYIHSDNNNPDNQILIQQQTTDIKLSGVIFSRTPDLGSPYYTINYDISSFTDSVTSGKINNVMKIFREITFLDTTHIFYKLIVAIKEFFFTKDPSFFLILKFCKLFLMRFSFLCSQN